ncbi:hypothetical protein [Pseudomonas thivervalensis]|jgi:uncharacterized delta-60 repeat protein|uniref:hypothetical protein n=1 Tax=Pseudomonas thivervalensis TaxID=86265 RepID=UPI00069D4351|nr:hypothetical protein [Pseudomonas thivervalensis]OAB54328.1 hypothetical protein APS14_15330 [Pseudomonas thivervalensis]SDF37532.1 delta-60 repeat domain-containing protein [Pseudomonas thivervalensis]
MTTQKATKAAGDLDPSFGDGGTVVFTLAQGSFLGASKLLSDGKIFSAGANADDVVLVRHLSNGDLDDSFGEHGITRIKLFPGVRIAKVVLNLQPNDHAFVFGSVGEKLEAILFLLRILPDGTLDTRFGMKGRVIINLPEGENIAHVVAVQPDGKIVLVARVVRGYENYDEVLLRLDSKGELDLTFGETGMVFVGKVHFSSLIVLPDDRLLFAGAKKGALLFARYLSDGRPDPSFGEEGVVTIEVSQVQFAQILAAERQRDGKIVAVGSAEIESKGAHALIARINPDGSLDETFHHGTPAVIGFQGYEVQNHAVAIQSDNKIIAAGSSLGTEKTANFTLMRFLPNGAPDLEFGLHGRVMTDLGGLDLARSVSLQADGKIVASGWILGLPGTGVGIARYLS